MSSFVTFPGTSGNYAARTDVNLLDADTAHLHQSVGAWVAGADTTAFIHDTGGTPAPPYGDGTAKATTDGTGPLIASLTTPTLAAVEHTFSVDVWSATAGREGFVTFDGTAGTVVALSAGWTRLSATKTVTSGTKAVTVSYRQLDDSAPAAAEDVWLARACLRTGASAVFMPSLRIVGDFDARWRAKFTDTGTDQATIANWGGSDPMRHFQARLRVVAGDYVPYAQLRTSPTGNGTLFHASAFTPGVWAEHRLTRVKSTGVCSWTEDGVERSNGAAIAAGEPLAPPTSTSPADVALTVGAAYQDTTRHFNGDFDYVEVRDGIDGPVVARFSGADVLEAVT